jgi:hypothetical protein
VKAGESFGPGDIRERLTPLGQVEVRAGETARFDARVP